MTTAADTTAATAAVAAATVGGTTSSEGRHNGGVPRLTRRLGPAGTALMLWDIWRRLPPQQRRWLVQQGRTHGLRVAKTTLDARRRTRR
jgi:hypothetical protein